MLWGEGGLNQAQMANEGDASGCFDPQGCGTGISKRFPEREPITGNELMPGCPFQYAA